MDFFPEFREIFKPASQQTSQQPSRPELLLAPGAQVDKDAGEDFDKFFGDPEALSHELVLRPLAPRLARRPTARLMH